MYNQLTYLQGWPPWDEKGSGGVEKLPMMIPVHGNSKDSSTTHPIPYPYWGKNPMGDSYVPNPRDNKLKNTLVNTFSDDLSVRSWVEVIVVAKERGRKIWVQSTYERVGKNDDLFSPLWQDLLIFISFIQSFQEPFEDKGSIFPVCIEKERRKRRKTTLYLHPVGKTLDPVGKTLVLPFPEPGTVGLRSLESSVTVVDRWRSEECTLFI